MFPSAKKPTSEASTVATTPPPAPPAPAAAPAPLVQQPAVELPILQPDLSALLATTSHQEPLLVADFFREEVEKWMDEYVTQSMKGERRNKNCHVCRATPA